jgi:hypothetical protein
MAYSSLDKAQAIEMIRANDGVISDTLILVIRQTLHMDISRRTLFNWWSATSGKPVSPGTTKVAPMQNTASESALQKKPRPISPDHQPEDAGSASAALSTSARLLPKLRDAATKFVDKATEDKRMNDLTSDRLMTAAGIAIDKILKLEGVPDVVVSVTVSLYEKCQRYGLDPEKILRGLETAIDEAHGGMITNVHGAN